MRKIFLLLLSALILVPLPSGTGQRYTFDDLMSAIESSNTDIRKSDQAILESHYDTLDAKGAYTPTIDLLLTGTYMANPSLGPIKVSPSDVKGLPDIMASVWTDPIDVSMKMDNNRVQGQLTLTQPIYTWGKISNAVKLYETVESLRTMERNDKLDQKETELRTRLDALYWMGEIYDLLDSIDETADRLISIAETGKENGMLLEEDVLDAKIQQRQSDVARRELDSQYSAVIEGLRTLTGIPDLSPDMIDYTPDTSLYDSILSMDSEEIKSISILCSLRPIKPKGASFSPKATINRGTSFKAIGTYCLIFSMSEGCKKQVSCSNRSLPYFNQFPHQLFGSFLRLQFTALHNGFP